MLKGNYKLGRIKPSKTKEKQEDYNQLEFVYMGGSFMVCDFSGKELEVGKEYEVCVNAKGWGQLDLLSLKEVKEEKK